MRACKYLIAILVLSLSPMALGYANNHVDCDKVNFYSGTENTRQPANHLKSRAMSRVSQVLGSRASKFSKVQSIGRPSKQTR